MMHWYLHGHNLFCYFLMIWVAIPILLHFKMFLIFCQTSLCGAKLKLCWLSFFFR